MVTDTSVEHIINFDEKTYCDAVESVCPTLANVIQGAMGVESTDEKICFRAQCYGLLFKARYPKNQPSVLAHRNDQLMIAAGIKRRYFKVLMNAGVTNSYKTALKKNVCLGENHDLKVQQWKNTREIEHKELETLEKIDVYSRAQHELERKSLTDSLLLSKLYSNYNTVSLYDMSHEDDLPSNVKDMLQKQVINLDLKSTFISKDSTDILSRCIESIDEHVLRTNKSTADIVTEMKVKKQKDIKASVPYQVIYIIYTYYSFFAIQVLQCYF